MARNLDDLYVSPMQNPDDESKEVLRLVRQWAEKEIIAKRMEFREGYDALFDVQWLKVSSDLGLGRLTLARDRGGFGWNQPDRAPDLLSTVIEIGRADASLGLLASGAWIPHLLVQEGTDVPEQLPPSSSHIEGGAPLVSFILPGSGLKGEQTPLFLGRPIRALAVKGAAGHRLTGNALRPLWSGARADAYCVVCADEDGEPLVAVVPRNTPGVETAPPVKTTGLNACTNADVTFRDVLLKDGDIIRGRHAVQKLFVWLDLLAAGACAGACANFFEILADWSDNRVIKGGTTLKENPLCASVLADVAQETALAKLLLFDLAGMTAGPGSLEHPQIERTFTYAGLISCRVMEGLVRAANRGLELMGSAGYAKEWHVEKHWRDIKTVQSILAGAASNVPAAMDAARFFYGCTTI